MNRPRPCHICFDERDAEMYARINPYLVRDGLMFWDQRDIDLAALRQRVEKAEALIEEVRKAMGGYPDSDLVSLATTLKVQDGVAEKAEARVAELLGLLGEAHVHVVCSNRAGWGAVIRRIDAALEEGGEVDA